MRLYDAGKKHFLKKCENKASGKTGAFFCSSKVFPQEFPRQVVSFAVLGTRFLAADSEQSVLWCFFEAAQNAIRVFADETAPRYCTAMAPLDYNTGECLCLVLFCPSHAAARQWPWATSSGRCRCCGCPRP